jgi:hypothetical protein
MKHGPVPMGVTEIAYMLGVEIHTVSVWRQRRIFPDPAHKLASGAIWWETDVMRWAAMTGRLRAPNATGDQA